MCAEKESVMTHKEIEVQAFLAARKAEGLKIDPATAEVTWKYALTLDPYGIYGDMPEECRQVGREYFARAPGSDIWVKFGDLPKETRDVLWKAYERELAFPAGLPGYASDALSGAEE
jgi:hypothetical protein